MITVKCELNDQSLYQAVDKAFVDDAGMSEISDGLYEGDGSRIFNSGFKAIDMLLKTKGFISSVKRFTRDVNGEEEDVLEYYSYLLESGKL